MEQKLINQLKDDFNYWGERENRLKEFLTYVEDLPEDIKNKIKSEISCEIDICADEKQKISDEYYTFYDGTDEGLYSDLTSEQEDYIIESGMERLRGID